MYKHCRSAHSPFCLSQHPVHSPRDGSIESFFSEWCVCVCGLCSLTLLYLCVGCLWLFTFTLTTQKCVPQNTTALVFVLLLKWCAIKYLWSPLFASSLYCLPSSKTPWQPLCSCKYKVPIDMTQCPFLSRYLLGRGYMLMGVFVQLVVCAYRCRNSCLSWVVLACGGAVRGQTPCHIALTQCTSAVAWLQPGRPAWKCANYMVVAKGRQQWI